MKLYCELSIALNGILNKSSETQASGEGGREGGRVKKKANKS